MDPKWISELTVAARNVAITFLAVAAIVIGWTERESIGAAAINLTERMQTAEISGVKVSFGHKAFALNKDLALVSTPQQILIRDQLKNMTAHEVDRLLHRAEYPRDRLSDQDLHCDYENATSTMRLYAAADAGLIEKKLIERIPRADLTKKLREAAVPASALGGPSSCYQMALTPLGSNLKSVLVSELSRVFGVTSYAAGDAPSPSDKKTQEARSAAQR